MPTPYEGTYYRFDRAGNLTVRRDDQRELDLVWDANQRLIESHSNGTITHYGYDPLGRRLFKETGAKRTQFYWDGDALVGESEVANSPKEPLPIEGKVVAFTERRDKAAPVPPHKVREYAYYPETFEPLALIDGEREAQRVYHYHNDLNGCPTRLTDASGEVKWAVSYTAWGKVSKLHVNGVNNPIRLQGQYEDAETGLHYNRYRYYEATTAHFLSQDPLGLLPSENLYRFAPNIFGWNDPFGLSCKSARRRAVRKAWKEEQDLVRRTGVGTRAWTKAEKKELLATGKVAGYEGHHINNVATHPHLAGNPDNIKFVKGRSEHLAEHGGNFQNPTSGPLLTR